MARRGRPKKKKEKFAKLKDIGKFPVYDGEPPVVKKPIAPPASTNEIDLRPLTIGRPQRKPTEKQLSDYVKFTLGQIRLNLRKGTLDDIDEIKVCLKLKLRV